MANATEKYITNADFASTDTLFKKACEIAGIPNTARQASKFRAKVGKAYKHIGDAREALRKNTTAA